jgi:hypothetical protein
VALAVHRSPDVKRNKIARRSLRWGVNALDRNVRRFGKVAATGVVEGLGEMPKGEEPGYRAQRLARGVAIELRNQLGDRGDGPLSQSLSSSAARIAKASAQSVVAVLAVAFVAGCLVGAVALAAVRK